MANKSHPSAPLRPALASPQAGWQDLRGNFALERESDSAAMRFRSGEPQMTSGHGLVFSTECQVCSRPSAR